MKNFIRKYLGNLYLNAVKLNKNNIFNLLENNHSVKFLDLGCDDGSLTIEFAKQIGTKNVYGIDLDINQLKKAKKKGIKVKKGDINNIIGFPSNYFDVITANQVIEHLYNSDNFLKELYRILKPGGYAIISTENGSSWCNIIASIMGWQIFSLTNISTKKLGIGNPFAFFRNTDEKREAGWNHIRIYNLRGLWELFEVWGFLVEKIEGAGYFPFSAYMGKIDIIHSHFISFKIRKKNI